MRRLICILLVLVLLPVCSLTEEARKVFREEETDPFPEDAQLLTLTVCPLLGADCMLLTYGEHSMLVDVGKETQTKTVLEMLQNAGVESVESFFSTHPHGDHIGGLIPLIEGGLQVGTFYTVFPHDYVERKTAKHYMRDTLRLLAEKEIPVVDLKTGDTVPFGDVKLTVIRMPDELINPLRNCNEMSAMLKVEYGDCSLLLTADVEPTVVSQLLFAENYDLKVDILKYPHHGISYIRQEFLDNADPEYVFFTHSASDTKRAQRFLARNGYTWMNFATWGPIICKTDGKKWTVRQDILPDFENYARKYKFPQ